MHGTYGGQSGLSVEFYPKSAIVACGEAARAYPYVVQASGSQAVIKIEDPAHPLVFAFKPNGELAANAGPYEVHGRTITGKNDNGDFTFAALNTTCNLGTLDPGATPSAPPPLSVAATITAASATPGATANPGGPVLSTPAAPTGNAVLSIVSAFPAQPGVLNPFAGYPFVLLQDNFAAAIANSGVQVPPACRLSRLSARPAQIAHRIVKRWCRHGRPTTLPRPERMPPAKQLFPACHLERTT